MSLFLQAVRVATGSDEEGLLVFTDDQRLVAVLPAYVTGMRIYRGAGFSKGALARWTDQTARRSPIWTRRKSGWATALPGNKHGQQRARMVGLRTSEAGLNWRTLQPHSAQ